MKQPLTVGIIVGSTRQGRRSAGVARWIQEQEQARQHLGTAPEWIDLLDFPLPFYGEDAPHADPHIHAWKDKIELLDALILVGPEYNHAPTAVLKNAIDHLGPQLVNKAAALVTFGSSGGVRAAEHLRQILAERQVATVRQQAAFSLFTDFKDDGFMPAELHAPSVKTMFEQLQDWGTAMRWLREGKAQLAPA